MTCHYSVAVREGSQAAAARFTAQEQAAKAGFDDADAHRAGIVATELATNLVKHTDTGGEVLVQVVGTGSAAEIEIIAIDKGPGIADLTRAMRDGHSTSGTPGNGLGAVRRLTDDFETHSQPGKGTAIWTRLRARRASRPAPRLCVSGISIAKAGEPVCGDAWAVKALDARTSTLVADGLGHGLYASEAAVAAIRAFLADRGVESGAAVMERLHGELRPTRGAAAAILSVDAAKRLVLFAGVGNIAGAIVQNGVIRHTVSHNGTLGHQAQHFREYQYPFPDGATFVLHSDGLATHWVLSAYPGLVQRHPALIAAVLYRDFTRGRDDVTVVVGRLTT